MPTSSPRAAPGDSLDVADAGCLDEVDVAGDAVCFDDGSSSESHASSTLVPVVATASFWGVVASLVGVEDAIRVAADATGRSAVVTSVSSSTSAANIPATGFGG